MRYAAGRQVTDGRGGGGGRCRRRGELSFNLNPDTAVTSTFFPIHHQKWGSSATTLGGTDDSDLVPDLLDD